LAKRGKEAGLVKNDIALKGAKIGKRKYDDVEIDCNLLEEKEEYHIRVFRKEPVQDKWEISVEICEGTFQGKKLKIYGEPEIERKLHRHHEYMVRIKDIFTHHVTICKTIKEVKDKKERYESPKCDK
jgi:hypothetical protein